MAPSPTPALDTPTPANKHLGVIGLGLIGGSLALAAKRAGWRVSACNRTTATARAAASAGQIDHSVEDIAALAACDIICIAVPMRAYDDVFAALAPALAANAIITDGGSTKTDAVSTARRHLGALSRRFVPAHPIAGKEQSGWQAASADLFNNHLVIVCPEGCDADAVAGARALWQQTGARLQTMSAATHDGHLAAISHLPHLLSYALVSAIDRHKNSEELLQYAAGGFHDFTRIAGSHPHMWRDICLANADNLLEAVAWYQRELSQLADHIKAGDGAALSARFTAARTLRQQWLNTLEQ